MRRKMTEKTRVLFICTANAARSQMAEGLLRAKYGDRYEVFSAGTRQSRVSRYAIQVMEEIGIDISHHTSKTLDVFIGESLDIVVTVCDLARETCPVFPRAHRQIHRGFSDPYTPQTNNGETLMEYRTVRDEIAAWIETEFGTR
jgi:arsenate reductase